jgi:hypothetical protein
MSQKPTIKIDGVEISQTTTYIDYDAWLASPLTKALKDKLDAAVAAEREAIAQMVEDAPPLAEFVKNDKGGCMVCGFTPKLAAAAIRARGQQ